MQTVQIVLDEALLRAADQAAPEAKLNRSALVREALRDYLKKLQTLERERQDREGYQRLPESAEEQLDWEQEAAWPDD